MFSKPFLILQYFLDGITSSKNVQIEQDLPDGIPSSKAFHILQYFLIDITSSKTLNHTIPVLPC